jgi:hypothetical protein
MSANRWVALGACAAVGCGIWWCWPEEHQGDVLGKEAIFEVGRFSKEFPWAQGVVFTVDQPALAALSRAESKTALRNLSLLMGQLRDFTDAGDNLKKQGVVAKLKLQFSHTRAAAWFERDKKSKALTVRLPVDHELAQSELDQLIIAYRGEYERALENFYHVRIQANAVPGRCGSTARFSRIGAGKLAIGLRELDRAVAAYPIEFHRRARPTIALLQQLRDDNGPFAGQQARDCLVIDVSQDNAREVLHHELGHYWFTRRHVKWNFPGAYRHTWNYYNLDANPRTPRPGFVSAYAMKNRHEDFAETAEHILTDCRGLVSDHGDDRVVQGKVRQVAAVYSAILHDERKAAAWWQSLCGRDIRSWGR